MPRGRRKTWWAALWVVLGIGVAWNPSWQTARPTFASLRQWLLDQFSYDEPKITHNAAVAIYVPKESPAFIDEWASREAPPEYLPLLTPPAEIETAKVRFLPPFIEEPYRSSQKEENVIKITITSVLGLPSDEELYRRSSRNVQSYAAPTRPSSPRAIELPITGCRCLPATAASHARPAAVKMVDHASVAKGPRASMAQDPLEVRPATVKGLLWPSSHQPPAPKTLDLRTIVLWKLELPTGTQSQKSLKPASSRSLSSSKQPAPSGP